MFRERAKTMQGISLTLDVFFICLAFGTAFVLRIFHEQIPLLRSVPVQAWSAENAARSDYAVLLGVSLVAWIVSLKSSGVYLSHRSERYSTILRTYARALTFGILATTAVAFVLKMGSISRMFFGYFFGSA
ncbi:MAG: hypothetical protein ACE5E4_12700, partial [Candidatus Binatia bacterium]